MKKVLGSALKPTALPFTALGGHMLWQFAGKPLWKSASGEGAREMDEYMQEMRRLHAEERNREVAADAVDTATKQRMAYVTAHLAASNPQKFNEVLAGERLPKDAVVLGGQPRVDLLEELAYNLATRTPGGGSRFNF
jgi:hypothetical protein